MPICPEPINHRFDLDYPGSECCGSDVREGRCIACQEPARLIVICVDCGDELDAEEAHALDYEKFLQETAIRVSLTTRTETRTHA